MNLQARATLPNLPVLSLAGARDSSERSCGAFPFQHVSRTQAFLGFHSNTQYFVSFCVFKAQNTTHLSLGLSSNLDLGLDLTFSPDQVFSLLVDVDMLKE